MNRDQLYNDVEEAQRLLLDGRQATIWTAIPCIVQSVDLSAMTLEAQPTIQGVVEDENGKQQFVNLPLLVDVPIVFPSAGGFTITLPIAANDEVLVIFASRCIDAWWQSGGIQKPMEARMHDLSDGFAIPGPRSQPRKISGISATDIQIRLDSGAAYISIDPAGKIKLHSTHMVEVTADTEIKMTAPLITAEGNFVVTGTMSGTGGTAALQIPVDIEQSGDFNTTGTVAADVDVTGNGTSLHTHTHPQSGGGNTGAPNP